MVFFFEKKNTKIFFKCVRFFNFSRFSYVLILRIKNKFKLMKSNLGFHRIFYFKYFAYLRTWEVRMAAATVYSSEL